jgi:hypothetical protein
MTEFEVQRCSRKCAKTERELQPGEAYYSVLVNDGDQMKRLDFAAESWGQPPDGTIAWWKSHMPGLSPNRLQWAPNDVLLDYFQSLEGNATQADVRFVLALLLVRRRIARWEHSESDNQNQETMVLYCPRHELEFRVPVRMPAPERLTEIQQQLSRLLVTPAAA